MCGIAGFISANPAYDGPARVADMLRRMRHRGPDQSGQATYGQATLGMARLSIVDMCTDRIPYADPTGTCAVVYNGEIYNHLDLRARLAPRYEFDCASDAQTVLYSFMEWGPRALADYNGMYAFALYDGREDATYVVRDKAGEKPLYYLRGADYFAFASEMKALFALVEPVFNRRALSYQAFEFTVGRETLFENILVLQPGEYIRYKDGRVLVRSYWKAWDHPVAVPGNEKRVLADLADLVEDAILLRMRNNAHQTAAFISGGLDSALVACIAKPDFLYTAHYDYADFDELDYARMVADHVGRELVVVKPTRDDFLRTRRDVAFHLDTPCTWTSFPLWMLLERCRQDGLRVFLTGDGADELFAGYHRYHLLNHDQQIYQMEAMQQYTYIIDRYYGSPVSRYARLVNRCDNPYDRRVAGYVEKTVQAYFAKSGQDIIHAMGLCDFYTTMQVLLQMGDRLAMAFGMENRSPFLDHRVIQYAFSMPSGFKIRDGVTKWALKEIARRRIPRAIVERLDKRGFSAPVNRWFQWETNGKYDRRGYRQMALDDWQAVFNVHMGPRAADSRGDRAKQAGR